LGVPEAVGGHRELDRDKGVVAPLEVLGAAREHVIDHRLADRLGQELVEDEPLVMPAHHPLGLGEKLLGGVAGPQVGLDVGHHPVVEAHDGQVELGDDEVLVVARVAGDGDVLAVAGPGRAGSRCRLTPPPIRGSPRSAAWSVPVDGLVVQLR
jgi:hypothetical protein